MNTKIQEEISQLKLKYGDLCRVTATSEGGASVTVRKPDQSLNVTFKLKADYPNSLTEFSATCPFLGGTRRDALISHLHACAQQTNTPEGMLDFLLDAAYDWCEQEGVKLGPEVCPS